MEAFGQAVQVHSTWPDFSTRELRLELIREEYEELEEAGRITNTDIARELTLPPVKIHCSVLAEDAIKAAIEDYNKKGA